MSEDEFYLYDQSRSGQVSKREKSNLEHYNWWWKNNVKFENTAEGTKRITPLTEFEKRMGVTSALTSYYYEWCTRPRYECRSNIFNEDEWRIFQQTHVIDYGELRILNKPDIPVGVGQGNYDWDNYFRKKAKAKDLIVVNISNLEFREKQKPAVVEKVRPNPKEESIASVKIEKPKPVEVEPIKEVVKYSPLMIAGVIAVIVLILWRRA